MQVHNTIQDSVLSAKWDTFLQDRVKDVVEAVLDYPETRSFYVDFKDIQLADLELTDLLLQRPAHALRVGAAAVNQVDVPIEPRPLLQFRIFGLPETEHVAIRDLRVEHLGRFVSIDGMVKKVTEPADMIHEACFECKFCANLEFVVQVEELLMEPVACSACEKTGPWRLLEENSKWMNHQKLQLEESPEGMRGGLQAGRLEVHIRDDLVNHCTPGDRIRVNGIMTNRPVRDNRAKRTTFTKALMAVSVEILDRDYEDMDITDEDVEAIKELAARPDIHEHLATRLAPTIFGMDHEKQAFALAAFGGVRTDNVRGDIHLLLVGDPSVAKSRLLYLMRKFVPRSIFATGKGSTAAGLTATAVKDDFGGGRWTLEAGVLVLADEGAALVDELDKMDSHDQDSLLQAMEQQEISIAKAGITATLKSRCSLWGAANPKNGRFNPNDGLWDQVGIPGPLLSRFDLIFGIEDKPNLDRDMALALHLAKVRAGEIHEDEDELRLFQKYVAHAKQLQPKLNAAAERFLATEYANLRAAAYAEGRIALTPRDQDGLMRLAQASARMRLSNVATMADAERALAVKKASLRSVGAIDDQGRFDMDVIVAGMSHDQQEEIRKVLFVIKALERGSDGFAREEDVIKEVAADGVEEDRCLKALERLRRHNQIYPKGGTGTYRSL